MRRRAERLAAVLDARGIEAQVVPSDGAVGGGGAPGLVLKGWAVALPETWAALLRQGEPPVVGRSSGPPLLDPRSVPTDHDEVLRQAVLTVADRVRASAER